VSEPETLSEQLQRFTRYISDPRARWEPWTEIGVGLSGDESVTDCIANLFFIGWMSSAEPAIINTARQCFSQFEPEEFLRSASPWAEREFQRMIATNNPNAQPNTNYKYQHSNRPPNIPAVAEIDGETLQMKTGSLQGQSENEDERNQTDDANNE
jgi:hypothetical protein